MSLNQAVWIIMGANIGTTITGQLIALDVGALAPLIAFIGVVLVVFVKNKKLQHIGGIVAGVGVIFIGMGMMSDAMLPLRDEPEFIQLMTSFKNPLLGVMAGALFTAVIQSSSATTVMVVGFVNSGMLSLQQAVWIIMGANIGTTITGQLIALDVGAIAPLLAFAGVAVITFSKKATVQHYGQIVAGLGILFLGMEMMSSSMSPLRDSEAFINLMTQFGNPLIGILVGAVFTAIIQSSSASVGILQTLAIGGLIDLPNAVFVLFGQNIGTCITAVLASVGTNRNAKRTTAIHLMFNVVGTVIFVVLCMVTPFVDWMIATNPANPAAQIANVHTIFNIATTVILFPFGPMLVNIAKKILPDTQVKHVVDADQWFEGLMASKHHLGVSTIAISQIHEEIRDMLSAASKNVDASFLAVEQGPGEDGIGEIENREEEIDLANVRLSKKISRVLVLDQTPKDIETLNKMYSILGNIERIGDHAMNLAEYAQTILEKDLSFSEYAQSEFSVMADSCSKGMKLLEQAAAGEKKFELAKVQEIEQKIDDITRKFRQNQIDGMRAGSCNVEASILYSEMLTDYERIGDHMLNIAEAYDVINKNDEGISDTQPANA